MPVTLYGNAPIVRDYESMLVSIARDAQKRAGPDYKSLVLVEEPPMFKFSWTDLLGCDEKLFGDDVDDFWMPHDEIAIKRRGLFGGRQYLFTIVNSMLNLDTIRDNFDKQKEGTLRDSDFTSRFLHVAIHDPSYGAIARLHAGEFAEKYEFKRLEFVQKPAMGLVQRLCRT